MADKIQDIRSATPAIINRADVLSNEDPSKKADLRGGLIRLKYYESIIQDTVRVTLIYADSTKGWMFINEDTTKQAGASYIAATGGTITTSGNYKIHTFTADANFVVSDAGNAGGSNKVSYMVVAGGGGGGTD